MHKPWVKKSLSFCALAVFLIASFQTYAFAKTSNQTDKAPVQTIVFEGFPLETQIYYTILSDQTVMAEGVDKTDSSGMLAITMPIKNESNTQQRIYDFKISNKEKFVDLLLRHDLKTGKISTTGKGLNEFSEVKVITPQKTAQFKTDWVGAFQETASLNQNDKNQKTFQLALNGFANFSALAPQSPVIIKILQAPNGGLLTETPNQPPTLSPPSSGIYPLSTSSAGPLASASALIVQNYVTAMLLMAEQLSAVMMEQMLPIGQFFDAKMQMETQRTYQELTAQAHKDYHPSEQMCRVGSYVRSLASTEQKSVSNKVVLNKVMMDRYRNHLSASSAINAQNDMNARLKQYREIYCNPEDNNNGLAYICEHDQDATLTNSTPGAAKPGGIGAETAENLRINKDVDFTRTMDFPQTLKVDLSDTTSEEDEEDVMALAKNLYWPTTINYASDEQLPKKRNGFLDAQRLIALKNVAHTSFTNLVALKSKAATPTSGGVEPGWTYMKTLMRDFGITDDEIETMIGEEPSYWAQMDILTKKMYQMPSFYTNLYDKPANVERIGVTLDAIKLMQMRDYYDSKLRHEMLNSAMIETELGLGNHYSAAASGVLFAR